MVHKLFNKEAPRIQYEIFHNDRKKTLPGPALHNTDDIKRKTLHRGTEVRPQFLHQRPLVEMGTDADEKRDVLGKITRENMTRNERETHGKIS